jgi:hypothetical protein
MIGFGDDADLVFFESKKETGDEKMSSERYVIVRTYTAGVFAGFLESRNGQEVVNVLHYREFDDQKHAREELRKLDGHMKFLILGAFIEGNDSRLAGGQNE